MANFEAYAPLLHRLEKGFVNDPDDNGGATMDGVTLATYRQFYGESKTVEDLKNITWNEWCHIMKAGYWDKCKADDIDDQCVAELIADWCVNSGLAGLRRVQEIIGARPDGIAGPITLSLINSSDSQALFKRILLAREQWFRKIVQNNPSKKKFLKGWLNRLDAFEYKL